MIIEKILNDITAEFKNIPGVIGIVLGGSRARGTNNKDSDIDIGIYYDESEGFNVTEVDKIATKLDDEKRKKLVTSLGEWGPWVNAGGWLIIQGYHVDFIFRDINRVYKVIDDCLNGKISSNYQTGHPHAYLNAMYMGEVAICKVLDDPKNKISELKVKTMPYPENLKNAIIGWYMFEASFSLMFAKSNIDKDDISYVCGHSFRSISSLNQVLFALNNEYCINEKKAVKMIDTFKIKPQNYKKRIDEVVTLISSNESNTRRGVEILEELVNETKDLC
ncbi:nucleotidyltransferase domain-containing protein [Clostridium sp.]|uniref:nucleotidyltransferase domain-containing protein n=1 Tax=Clostridium sp. TaxID=1506 RepID=UPI0025BCE638|nr:nucleotidyltransferase domain-containing protein [Clostridium sp.]